MTNSEFQEWIDQQEARQTAVYMHDAAQKQAMDAAFATMVANIQEKQQCNG